MTARPLLLAVALDGAGWHPAAWRLPGARPGDLLTAAYWVDLVRRAEAGGLDLVTVEDAMALQSSDPTGPDGRTDEVRGRLDAVLVAARVAPSTTRIGLVPTATVTHTEPFHLAKAVATLDYVSSGRAGWAVAVSARADEAAHFGRRPPPGSDEEAYAEAGDAVEVVRRLWDSWEDDAEIRDAATGRFVDRDRLHPIDFEGRWFRVRGPSITPRPPQGQPVVAALATTAAARAFAARAADLVFVTPTTDGEVEAALADLEDARERAGRPDPVHVLADLVVLLGDDDGRAQERWARLEAWSGRPYAADAEVFVGTPAALADRLVERAGTGLAGFRLRPAALPLDLERIADRLVPELRHRGALAEPAAAGRTLRDRLGLARPASRYAGRGG